MKESAREFVNALGWLIENRWDVIEEAIESGGGSFRPNLSKELLESNPPSRPAALPNAAPHESLGISGKTWSYWIKRFEGDAGPLIERIEAAQHLYGEKGADYQFRTPFVVFLERRLEVDLKNRRRDAEKAAASKSKKDIWAEQVKESLREET